MVNQCSAARSIETAELRAANLERALLSRDVIGQAKGMLMMVYNIDDAAAFELLRWRSQEANVKLARLAEQVVSDFSTMRHNGEMSQATYDNLLMTAHTRLT